MSARVFVTGGGGFVGSALLDELVKRNYRVRALVNQRPIRHASPLVETVTGSLFDAAALEKGMQGCDGVIHLVGIIMENPKRNITFERIHTQGTRNVVDATKRAGIKRYVHMSALGTRANAVSQYHKTKFAAEEYVRSGGLDWTILQPSLIHGPRGDFMKMEAQWARHAAAPFLFMPYFGAGFLGFGGAGQLQPVLVDDVARAFVDALENPKTIGKVYPLAGSQVLSWPQLHQAVSRAIRGKPGLSLPIPAWVGKLYADIGIARLLGFNRDQVEMSQEENTGDMSRFIEDFGWTPTGFEQALKVYAAQL